MLTKKEILQVCFLLSLLRVIWGIQFRIPDPTGDGLVLEQQLASDPLVKEFTKNAPHLSIQAMQKIEADLLKESKLKEEALEQEAGNCITDWTASCPKGWKKREKIESGEDICLAPSSYKGLCKTSQSFALYTPQAKEDWGRSCQVEWPCKDDVKEACVSGKRDFTLPCPEGFNLQDEETCAPDVSQYQGPCQGLANFASFSEESKKSWSETCGVVWPCFEECVNDYEAVCPKGWNYKGNGECIAPKHYSSTCATIQNFKYYTAEMKANFEKLCNVRFPCENTCEKNYSTQCPKGWLQLDISCTPPATYSTCSLPKLPFKDLSIDEKASFENECNVQWPCKETDFCKREWSLPCPEGWENILPPGVSIEQITSNHEMMIGIKCSPPVDYSGKCNSEQQFETEEQKRKWASECNQPWPCKENIKDKKLDDIILHPASIVAISKAVIKAKRPRSPYTVTDSREMGKHGPVEHKTGEVMPRQQKEMADMKEIYGKLTEYHHPLSKASLQAAGSPLNEAQIQYATEIMNKRQLPMIRQAPFMKQYEAGPKGYYSGGHFLSGSIY